MPIQARQCPWYSEKSYWVFLNTGPIRVNDCPEWQFTNYIIKEFKRCYLSNNTNGTYDDDVLQDEDHKQNSSGDENVDSDWLNKWCVCNFLLPKYSKYF